MKNNLLNIASVFLFLFALIEAGCSDEKINPSIEQSVTSNDITAEGWNSYLLLTENGRLKTILHYQHMTDYGEKGIKTLSKIKVDFYDSTQTATSYLTADSGRVEGDGAVMYGIGNVVAINDSGRTLKTEVLVWKRSTQKISTDRFVSITSPKEDVEGYGFESDQSIKNWTIFKPVITTISNLEEKKNEPPKKNK